MTDVDALQLIQRYATSYFAEDSADGWFKADKAAKEGGDPRRTIKARAIGGSQVPILKGRELATAMVENCEDSRLAVRDCGERLKRARQDGMLDMDAFNSLSSKKTKAAWLAAVQTVRGDYHRAVGELKQWQEYAELASAGQLPTLARPTPIGALIGHLADSKAFEPDRRLPPEPPEDDDGDRGEAAR